MTVTAEVLGISKKTLVQIEKGRIVANRTLVVAVISLFQNSDIVKNLLGNEPLEIIELLAHKDFIHPKKELKGASIDIMIVYSDKQDDTKNRDKYVNVDFKEKGNYPSKEELRKIYMKVIQQ